MKDLVVSIVLFHNEPEEIRQVLDSVLEIPLDKEIYLIDNSSNDALKEFASPKINYIFNDKNIGYGAAHNKIIKISIKEKAKYHLVLNPDVYFDGKEIKKLFLYMEQNKDVGNIMPMVRYPNADVQYLCKLLPNPLDLIFRRFVPFFRKKFSKNYELRWTNYDCLMNVPFLSGCFMFLNVENLANIGLFDEKFFMYLEDTDLNRRIHSKYKTIFYPDATITHKHGKGSYKNKKLLIIHLLSAIYYFNKYGWFFDAQRKLINKTAISNILNSKRQRNLNFNK